MWERVVEHALTVLRDADVVPVLVRVEAGASRPPTPPDAHPLASRRRAQPSPSPHAASWLTELGRWPSSRSRWAHCVRCLQRAHARCAPTHPSLDRRRPVPQLNAEQQQQQQQQLQQHHTVEAGSSHTPAPLPPAVVAELQRIAKARSPAGAAQAKATRARSRRGAAQRSPASGGSTARRAGTGVDNVPAAANGAQARRRQSPRRAAAVAVSRPARADTHSSYDDDDADARTVSTLEDMALH